MQHKGTSAAAAAAFSVNPFVVIEVAMFRVRVKSDIPLSQVVFKGDLHFVHTLLTAVG